MRNDSCYNDSVVKKHLYSELYNLGVTEKYIIPSGRPGPTAGDGPEHPLPSSGLVSTATLADGHVQDWVYQGRVV